MCVFHFLGSIFAFIKDNITGFSWLTGMYFAYRGLLVWRAQMTGKDKYEVAKNLLTTIYNVREKIGYLRSPMFMGGEIEAGMKKHFPDHPFNFYDQSAEDEKMVERAVMAGRWSKVRAVLLEYQVIKFVAIVHWDKPIENAFRRFEKVINGLKIRVDMLPRLDKNAQDGSKEKFNDYIFGLEDEATDKFGIEFNASIEDIKAIIRPALK
ncbi:MAG: hypothetical protein JWO30_3177 [Fibrobacteres bacterium]|nr:hypothetical protein [Fibrobacterota bacterium]